MNEQTSNLSRIIPLEDMIHQIRGQRVMLDADLARLFGVSTKRLNEQVKRNRDRFPSDFMFQLTQIENDSLMSQNATSKQGRGGRRNLPYAFTEHGTVMLANVLNSTTAVEASILVVRAFIRIRQAILSHADLSLKIKEIGIEIRQTVPDGFPGHTPTDGTARQHQEKNRVSNPGQIKCCGLWIVDGTGLAPRLCSPE